MVIVFPARSAEADAKAKAKAKAMPTHRQAFATPRAGWKHDPQDALSGLPDGVLRRS
jgi:hypothetical protein